jgi:hypothetical protein
LFSNINATKGCSYELIIVDNSEKKYTIFEAYNIGIKGGFWCFIHDDINIHSKDWGNHMRQIFESNSQIGLIGIASAKVKKTVL